MDLVTLARALARGLHLAGSFSLFGTILLSGFLLPANTSTSLRTSLRRLAWASLILALTAGLAWFLLQTADMASATSLSDVSAALPIVIQSTRFGHVCTLRALLLISAAGLFQKTHFRTAAAFAGLAVIAESWLGHGGAMSGPTGTALLISSIIHLTAAAAWTGSLPALFIAITQLPPAQAAALAKRYSPFGITCVLALIASATVQFIYLIATPAALFTTIYGRVALFKIAALAGLTSLAALNRTRLSPALQNASQPNAKAQLLRSIGFEIALGLAALLAAGLLLNLAPPAMAAMLGPQP